MAGPTLEIKGLQGLKNGCEDLSHPFLMPGTGQTALYMAKSLHV
jgi:hypothetical protein